MSDKQLIRLIVGSTLLLLLVGILLVGFLPDSPAKPAAENADADGTRWSGAFAITTRTDPMTDEAHVEAWSLSGKGRDTARLSIVCESGAEQVRLELEGPVVNPRVRWRAGRDPVVGTEWRVEKRDNAWMRLVLVAEESAAIVAGMTEHGSENILVAEKLLLEVTGDADVPPDVYEFSLWGFADARRLLPCATPLEPAPPATITKDVLGVAVRVAGWSCANPSRPHLQDRGRTGEVWVVTCESGAFAVTVPDDLQEPSAVIPCGRVLALTGIACYEGATEERNR